MMRTVFAKTNRTRGYILGIDEIKANKFNDFKRFINSFRSHKAVIKVN